MFHTEGLRQEDYLSNQTGIHGKGETKGGEKTGRRQERRKTKPLNASLSLKYFLFLFGITED